MSHLTKLCVFKLQPLVFTSLLPSEISSYGKTQDNLFFNPASPTYWFLQTWFFNMILWVFQYSLFPIYAKLGGTIWTRNWWFCPPGYATSKNCILLVLLVIYNPRRVSWHLSAFLFTFVVLHNTHGLRFKMLSDFVKGVCVSVSHSICCFCVILKRKGENITLTLLFKKKKGSLLLHFKWNKAGCCRLCIIDMFDAKKWR